MKHIAGKLVLISAVITLPFMAGCSKTVESGHVGVVIKQPYLGQGGVDPTAYNPGRVYMSPTSDLVEYPTTPQRIDENFHDLMTSRSTPVSFDAYIKMHIIPERAPELHQKFGIEYYKNNLQQPFRTMVRDFARSHTVQELTTDTSVTNDGQQSIQKELVRQVQHDKMPVVIDEVTIGAVTPPKEVLDETARTSAQQQRAQTEQSRAAAELSRAKAEKNKALADKAYAEEFNMTNHDFLVYRSLENQREMLEVIKDKPNVNIVVQTGNIVGPETNVTPTVAVGNGGTHR